MYRMIVHELGGPGALKREELSDVQAGPGEVVIDVKAVGCNFFDILITEGKYQVNAVLARRRGRGNRSIAWQRCFAFFGRRPRERPPRIRWFHFDRSRG